MIPLKVGDTISILNGPSKFSLGDAFMGRFDSRPQRAVEFVVVDAGGTKARLRAHVESLKWEGGGGHSFVIEIMSAAEHQRHLKLRGFYNTQRHEGGFTVVEA